MSIRILYVCNEDRATTKQRLLALNDLPVKVDVIYTSRLDETISFAKRVYRAVRFRLGIFPERNNENSKMIDAVRQSKYDIIFVEKGLSITRNTILAIKNMQPQVKIISYSLDDMMNPGNISNQYKEAIHLYDYHFTNKKYNVAELQQMGAHNVHYFRNAYSKQVHHPVTVSSSEMNYYGADVSFIGTYAKDRVESLRYLADNGIRIKVWGWGPSAERSGMIHPNITMTDKYVYDEEYPKVVASSKINLCFLRKENRDTETTRSIEIPACGGFMIAQRTKEHLELFTEGVEAVYFDTNKELLEKINYYLLHEEERRTIAANAIARCIQQDYSYHNQLTKIFNQALGYEAIGDSNYASHTV